MDHDLGGLQKTDVGGRADCARDADALLLTDDFRICRALAMDGGGISGGRSDMPRCEAHMADLRDLIADVVRSELQGALGEQTTRNLRKIIRREVAAVIDEMAGG